jgi:hypothetical protein
MKKFVTGMMIIGLTSLGFAQSPDGETSTFELEDVTVTPANLEYLNATKDPHTPDVARELQYKAAGFVVADMPDFDADATDPIEILFMASNGKLLAAYDTDGQILFTNERFENVVLPLEIRKIVFSENKGWQMAENQYRSSYNNKEVKKRYKINLTDGNTTKQMVINLKN